MLANKKHNSKACIWTFAGLVLCQFSCLDSLCYPGTSNPFLPKRSSSPNDAGGSKAVTIVQHLLLAFVPPWACVNVFFGRRPHVCLPASTWLSASFFFLFTGHQHAANRIVFPVDSGSVAFVPCGWRKEPLFGLVVFFCLFFFCT